MTMQNPERVVTKQDLKDFYDEIYPYLGGSSAFEELIAPKETDATSASKAYAIGDELILNGHLYNVTAAIALGDALVVGTNIALADDVTTQIKGKMDAMTVDATPTSSSTHLVESGGVYDFALSGISQGTTGNNGTVSIGYSKGSNVGSKVDVSVNGWNPLVGKWTSAVTAYSSATSVSLTNPFSSSSVNVLPFCQGSSGKPVTITQISVSTSTITLYFSALTETTSFKALVKSNS